MTNGEQASERLCASRSKGNVSFHFFSISWSNFLRRVAGERERDFETSNPCSKITLSLTRYQKANHPKMSDRALALVPKADAKRKRGVDGGDDDDEGASLAAPGSVSDPSLALVVPATGGPAITKAEYEKRLKDVRYLVIFLFQVESFFFVEEAFFDAGLVDGGGVRADGRCQQLDFKGDISSLQG